VIRIRTTGGGGWGDPLERPYDDVARDVEWDKVSVGRAAEDYGVVVALDDGGRPVVDVSASDTLRERGRAGRSGHQPFFDRGPGYARLAPDGAVAAGVDWLESRGSE
jgi:N-methylhydantoinase B